MPVQPSGVPASSTDPGTWSAFRDVLGPRRGIVLGGGFGCVDFDHVIDDGVLDPVVAEWLELCPATLIEVSPSGDGLHGRFSARAMPRRRASLRFIARGLSASSPLRAF